MFKIVLLGNYSKEILETLEPLEDQFKVLIKTSTKNIQSFITKKKPDVIFYKFIRITENSENTISKILTHRSKPLLYIVSCNISLKWIIKKVKFGISNYIDVVKFEDNTIEFIKQSLSHHIKTVNEKKNISHPALEAIIGNTPEMQDLKNKAIKYAHCNETLLITGETGTGKGLLAEAIHKIQFGDQSPFIGRNCGAIPDQLFESEVFGTTKGSYTDAKDKPGFFEQANSGTLFLDEVGEISPHIQVKILQAVEEKKVLRLGDQKKIPVNIRLISATNRNLSKAVKKGIFRSDLYYRLNTLNLHIPPLRKRKDDIYQLTQFIFNQRESNKKISDSAMDKILSHNWPGNVRELFTVLKRADILSSDEDIIKSDHIILDS